MLNWFRKKPRSLQELTDEQLKWSVARVSDQDGDLFLRYTSDKALVAHPELPWRLGVAIEHSFENQRREMIDPLYNEIEDRLLELLAGPPRCGLFVLALRNERMVEWICYCQGDAAARRIAGILGDAYGDNGICAMGADDPNWEIFREYTPR